MTIKQRPEAKMEMRFVLCFFLLLGKMRFGSLGQGITNQKITLGFVGMGNR